ncbi:Metal tolerance protein 2 [Acorus gramineus]|uniref:Metal tolerance protein 2 n=1 Tax=Acorus gramineus TaxID=55184 RepID=A0AAV8ZZR0_ACOGR|nr:Metal tolerance protein 2 [Acorus gramineus]
MKEGTVVAVPNSEDTSVEHGTKALPDVASPRSLSRAFGGGPATHGSFQETIKINSLPSEAVIKVQQGSWNAGKFESLGALGISGMLLLTSGGIAWHAIDVLQALLDHKEMWRKGVD